MKKSASQLAVSTDPTYFMRFFFFFLFFLFLTFMSSVTGQLVTTGKSTNIKLVSHTVVFVSSRVRSLELEFCLSIGV
jgi:hypothetical protein